MSAALSSPRLPAKSIAVAICAGFACALIAAMPLTAMQKAVSAVIGPLCMSSANAGPLDKVEVINSYALPNVPGKRVTVVRVFYGPGGSTPPHRHSGSVTAYITKGEIRSQLNDGPIETFKVGQSFFEPPGTRHMVSANASTTEPAELVAVFVADEGAELTTMLK